MPGFSYWCDCDSALQQLCHSIHSLHIVKPRCSYVTGHENPDKVCDSIQRDRNIVYVTYTAVVMNSCYLLQNWTSWPITSKENILNQKISNVSDIAAFLKNLERSTFKKVICGCLLPQLDHTTLKTITCGSACTIMSCNRGNSCYCHMWSGEIPSPALFIWSDMYM